MKVLVLSHIYPNSIEPASGIFVHEQVKALVDSGCQIKVVSPIPWTPFPLNILKEKWSKYSKVKGYEQIEGIDVYYPRKVTFPNKILAQHSGRFYYWAVKKLVQQISKEFRFDLIHSHVALYDGYAGTFLKNDYDVPLVTTIHGHDFQHTIHESKELKNRVVEVMNKSDQVVTVSNKLQAIGNKLINDKEKLVTIENGFSQDKVYTGQSFLENKYSAKNIILAVGNLIETKGMDLLIKSMSNFDNSQLIIIGSGPQRDNLEQLAARLNVAYRVEFLGALKHEKVMEYMSISDIFALPSWKEAFGVVYAEAMAHGKPVIACQGEGIDGIIKDGENGLLVKKRSVSSLKQALSYLINNEQERKRIGQQGQETIEKYTWKYNAKRNMEVYKQLLNISN